QLLERLLAERGDLRGVGADLRRVAALVDDPAEEAIVRDAVELLAVDIEVEEERERLRLHHAEVRLRAQHRAEELRRLLREEVVGVCLVDVDAEERVHDDLGLVVAGPEESVVLGREWLAWEFRRIELRRDGE